MTEVMERLRTETRDLHEQAEKQDFQQQMVHGSISRRDYVAWLEQMLVIHRTLEAGLSTHVGSDERFGAITPEQFQVPYLLADLAALGAGAEDIEPLPATGTFAARIRADAESQPLALLGYHYVLEGSNNGNRFVARRLLPMLELERDRGGRYLDPYGPEQPVIWKAFKSEMTQIPFAQDEIDALVAAARRMFSAISEVSAELSERSTADSSPTPALP